MTREEAIKIVRNIYQTDAEKEALATLIPELAESEDERIIRTLQDYVKNRNWPLNGPTQDEVLVWLEKRKEQKQECGEKGMNGPQEIGDWRGDEGVCKKQKEQNGEDEECTDFTIYYPHKNGKGEYECIPYSFYDSLTFFSEDKDLIDFHRACFYTEEECNEWIEQQKEEEGYEAIPVESTLEYKLGFKAGKESEKQKEQRPEWNEEDEKMLDSIIRVVCGVGVQPNGLREKQVSWLKALRPQSKDEIYKEKDEAFKLGKHQLAIKFMNYLDENRPEGKMSLSNGECEDIDKAFKENDWPKIMRYVEKYSPQPKQEWSEEDEEKLERVDDLLWMLDDYLGDDCSICEERTARLRDEIQKELCPWLKDLRPYWISIGTNENVAERFARIVRENLPEIGKDAQSQFEQLYFEITGNKMYGGYND